MKRFSVISLALFLAMTATSCTSNSQTVEEVCSQAFENYENWPSQFTEDKLSGCIGDFEDYHNQ